MAMKNEKSVDESRLVVLLSFEFLHPLEVGALGWSLGSRAIRGLI